MIDTKIAKRKINASRWLSTGQVARLLGCSRPTAVALIDKGILIGDRLGTSRSHRRVHIDTLHSYAIRKKLLSHVGSLTLRSLEPSLLEPTRTEFEGNLYLYSKSDFDNLFAFIHIEYVTGDLFLSSGKDLTRWRYVRSDSLHQVIESAVTRLIGLQGTDGA